MYNFLSIASTHSMCDSQQLASLVYSRTRASAGLEIDLASPALVIFFVKLILNVT